MVHFAQQRLKELFQNFQGKHVAVVGDLMLDRYFWGSIARISPEAPVPVVEVESESARLGGAANVAYNIKTLGGDPFLVGVIGNDNSGSVLRDLLVELGFTTDGVIIDESRPTTVKTRVIAHSQHVVRIDRETNADISNKVQQKTLEVLRQNIHSIDAIIIEDYNKGVIDTGLIKQLIQLANKHKKIIAADPKFNNFFEFQKVTVFKPNRKEVEEVMGVRLKDNKAVEEVGKALMKKLQAKSVLLTRGEKGMTLFEQSGTVVHVPTKARKIADVSGAGDTVISTFTMALTGGASVKEAATLANYAGGVVCGEVGIVPIERDALFHAVLNDASL